MISGLRAALGIRSSVPPKLPLPTSSLRSQNPERSGIEPFGRAKRPAAATIQANGIVTAKADFSTIFRPWSISLPLDYAPIGRGPPPASQVVYQRHFSLPQKTSFNA